MKSCDKLVKTRSMAVSATIAENSTFTRDGTAGANINGMVFIFR